MLVDVDTEYVRISIWHSLRRHYPDQVHGVDGNSSRPLSQASLAPPAPSPISCDVANLDLTHVPRYGKASFNGSKIESILRLLSPCELPRSAWHKV